MWISYSDSEVNRFHPICEKALNNALIKIGKDNQYKVIHHQYTGSLEMDYVVQNIATKKYLCVIEVKRTLSDIYSTRYQFQAMSYVQMNAEQSEQPFYILTNLESAFSFRYDSNRMRVFQQILKPGISHIGSFANDTEDYFTKKLTDYFSERLADYINNSYEYLISLEEFSLHMERIKENSKRWKTDLVIFLYEYIRGAFNFVNRNELKDIRLFRNNVAKICNEASQINFKDIFTYSEEFFEPTTYINNRTLVDLYDFGNQNVNGDLIAGILHSIVSTGQEHNGEVPTDLELARIVAELAKHSSGKLLPTDSLCDPAAGSGNLISSAIPIYNLLPKQIIVNDINSKLLELLSLRIGLHYVNTINKDNSPDIQNLNLADIERDFFSNTKVILMNPPFLAGINCIERKLPLYRRIKDLTGNRAKTNIGQMPFEGVFMELLLELVKPGTTISCVFPKTHLLGRGLESQTIRNLLLEQFGLQLIFTYPGNELFDNVTKDTCVIVGKAKQISNSVKIISSYDNISDIDINRFVKNLHDESIRMPGIVAKNISLQELKSVVNDGWRMLNDEMVEGIMFIQSVFQNPRLFMTFSELNFPIKRGVAGNNGGSDLIFFNSRADLSQKFKNCDITLSIGMRNAKLDNLDIGDRDSNFLDISKNSIDIIRAIIECYNSLPDRSRKQQSRCKTNQEWERILKKESKGIFPENSVLLPRAIRKTGRVYLSRHAVFVSTNFVVCSLPSLNKSIMLATWMSTIFYQLICEVSSKDQEGMRKMEVVDIEKTYIPILDNITQETQRALLDEYESIEFLNLTEPKIRNVDKIWANELFKNNASDNLNNAKKILEYLAKRRNS